MSTYIKLSTVYEIPEGRIVRVVNRHPINLYTDYVVQEWGVDEEGLINRNVCNIIGKFDTLQEACKWLNLDLIPKVEYQKLAA